MQDLKKNEKNFVQIDLQAIKYNLLLPFNKRLEQHQSALNTVLELEKAHRELYAKPKSTS